MSSDVSPLLLWVNGYPGMSFALPPGTGWTAARDVPDPVVAPSGGDALSGVPRNVSSLTAV